MGRISQAIPNIFNGISQQSPSIRLPSQGESQINGYSSLVSGLQKRPPVWFLARLMDVPTDTNVFAHLINRDPAEQYIAVFADNSVVVFDLSDGTEVPVFGPYANYTGTMTAAVSSDTVLTDSNAEWLDDAWIGYLIQNVTTGNWATITDNDDDTITTTSIADDWNQNDVYKIYYPPSAVDYLTPVNNARSDFEMITVADYSFLVNKQVTVLEDNKQNVVKKSNWFDEWTNTNCTVTEGGAYDYDPFGNGYCLKMTDDATNGYHKILGSANSSTEYEAGELYTASIFLRMPHTDGCRYAKVQARRLATWHAHIVCDLQDGGIESSGYCSASGSQAYANGWYRFWFTFEMGTDGVGVTTPFMEVQMSQDGSDFTYSGSSDSFFLYNAQYQKGTFAGEPAVTNAYSTDEARDEQHEAFLWIKTGINSCKYNVEVDGHQVSYAADTTPANYRTDKIATELATDIDALGDFQAIAIGSVVKIWKLSGYDFSFSCWDSWGDQAMVGIKNAVDRAENLPPVFFHGTRVKVAGTAEQEDDYYVEFQLNGGEYVIEDGDADTTQADLEDTSASFEVDGLIGCKAKNLTSGGYAIIRDNTATECTTVLRGGRYGGWVEDDEYEIVSHVGPGKWVECRGFDKSIGIYKPSMPHKLVRQSDGWFYLDSIDWNDREVGDVDSSPLPSLVTETISDVFFFRNRLGFTAGENVVMSRSGDFFNLFRESVLGGILDSDPIDVSVSHNKVSLIDYAVPWNKELMLFSAQTQFTAGADDNLTPSSIKIDATTEFESTGLVRPVGAGPYIYFPVPTGDFTSIREYFVDKENFTNDAANITAHCPKYLPPDIFQIVSSTSEDALFLLSSDSDERTAVYVYKYYWSGEEKLQSSWSKWTFDTDAILFIGMIQSRLYLIMDHQDGLLLQYMDLQSGQTDGNLDFSCALDHKVEKSGSKLDWYADTITSFQLGYHPDITKSSSYALVKGPDFTGEHGADIGNGTLFWGDNLLTWSEDFTASAWTKLASSADGEEAANPKDGAVNADEIIEDATENGHGITRTIPNAELPDNTLMWLSVFVKANTRDQLELVLQDKAGDYGYLKVNLATGGLIAATHQTEAYIIEELADGWYRLGVAVDTKTGATNPYIAFKMMVAGSSHYTGDGSSSLYLWGAMLGYGDYTASSPYTTKPAPYYTINTTTSQKVENIGLITVSGDEEDGECYIGEKYTMEYQLSTQYVRQDDKAIQEGRLQLQRLHVNFTDSGTFHVIVSPYTGSTYTYDYTHNAKLGTKELVVGSVYIATGTFVVPVNARNIEAIIKIQNASYWPSNIQSLEWEAFFTMLTQRR